MYSPDEVIIANEAQCKLCGDIIFSTHRHDFRRCSCGALAVDGGHDYLKRNFTSSDNFVERSIILPVEEWEKVVAGVEHAKENGATWLGQITATIRELRKVGRLNGY